MSKNLGFTYTIWFFLKYHRGSSETYYFKVESCTNIQEKEKYRQCKLGKVTTLKLKSHSEGSMHLFHVCCEESFNILITLSIFQKSKERHLLEFPNLTSVKTY